MQLELLNDCSNSSNLYKLKWQYSVIIYDTL